MRLRLLAVPGVSKVAVFGGEVRSIQVQVRPDELVRYGVGLEDVVAASRKATAVRGAGFLDTPNQRIIFRSEGQAVTPAEVGRTVVTTSGAASVVLSDVATSPTRRSPRSAARRSWAGPASSSVISAQFGANTQEVTERVEEALATLGLRSQAQGIELDATLFRPATFIDVATRSVRDALLLGGVFVIVVLFLFLFDIRTAAISCIAIPLSLLAAVIVLNSFGITLNTMTLGGLAIAIGEVVDDAVIDVENIVRRLRENRHAARPRPAASVVLDASLEVRSAVVYATFVVLLVFIPVLTLPGDRRSLLRAARPCLYPRAPRLAHHRADRHAGAMHDAAGRTRRSRIGAAAAAGAMDARALREPARPRSRSGRPHVDADRRCRHAWRQFAAAVLRQRLPPRIQGGPLHIAHVGRARHVDRRNPTPRPARHRGARRSAGGPRRFRSASAARNPPTTPGDRTTAKSKSICGRASPAPN